MHGSFAMPSTFFGHALPGTLFLLAGAARLFILSRLGDDRVSTYSPRAKRWHRYFFYLLAFSILVASGLAEGKDGIRVDLSLSSHKAMYMTMLPATLALIWEGVALEEDAVFISLGMGLAMEGILFDLHAQMKTSSVDAACHFMLRNAAFMGSALSILVVSKAHQQSHVYACSNINIFKVATYLCLMLQGVYFFVTGFLVFGYAGIGEREQHLLLLHSHMEVVTLFVAISSAFLCLSIFAAAICFFAKFRRSANRVIHHSQTTNEAEERPIAKA